MMLVHKSAKMYNVGFVFRHINEDISVTEVLY